MNEIITFIAVVTGCYCQLTVYQNAFYLFSTGWI